MYRKGFVINLLDLVLILLLSLFVRTCDEWITFDTIHLFIIFDYELDSAISNGYNRRSGRFMQPVFVLIVATRTSPSGDSIGIFSYCYFPPVLCPQRLSLTTCSFSCVLPIAQDILYIYFLSKKFFIILHSLPFLS